MPKVNQPTSAQQGQEGALSQNAHESGNFVSSDQYIVNTPGRSLLYYGKEQSHNQFHGGTIFHDAATGLVWAENQFSLGAGKTLMAKKCFE